MILLLTTGLLFTSCSKDRDDPVPELPQIDVYAAGYESNGTNYVAKVWKNNIATPLIDGSQSTRAYCVFGQDNDVFAGGFNGKVATIWKNGVATNLTDGSNLAQINSIYVVKK